MTRPVVGIIGNSYLQNDEYPVYATGRMNCDAVVSVAGAVALIVPADPTCSPIEDLLEICDGFVFTGGRPNVHPEEYGVAATEAYGTFDRNRDRLTLPLIRALTERGQPYLAICRGFQEMNVALGGTLYPEIRDLPGRMNHRMPPDGTLDEKFQLRHTVEFTKGGPFHKMMGNTEVMTNTLHGQGIAEPGRNVVVDGVAADGTPEAIYVKDAPGFAIGVQWHPEYRASSDPVSRALFEGLGDAARAWAARDGRPSLKSA